MAIWRPKYEDLPETLLGGRLTPSKYSTILKPVKDKDGFQFHVERRLIRDRFLSGDATRIVEELTCEQAITRIGSLIEPFDHTNKNLVWHVPAQAKDSETPRMYGPTKRILQLPDNPSDDLLFEVHDTEIDNSFDRDQIFSELVYTLRLNSTGAWYQNGANHETCFEIPPDRFCVEVEDAVNKGALAN